MKKIDLHIIILSLCVALLSFTGCNDTITVSDKDKLVKLDLNIALTDVSSSPVKAISDDQAATNDNERIHTLRIIIVRPDSTVEHNKFIQLQTPDIRKENESFLVVSDEFKMVYLIVNEGLTIVKNSYPVSNETLQILDSEDLPFSFGSISEGSIFPFDKVTSLKVRLTGPTEELAEALPMNECHKIWVSGQGRTADLFVTRAAVKFSFKIKNTSSRPYTLSKLNINKMLYQAYYMPNNAVYKNPTEDGIREITSFNVPSPENNNGYYVFEKDFGTEGIEIPSGQEKLLDAVYLLEGKYTDMSDDAPAGDYINYSIGVSFKETGGDWLQNEYFSNLPQLPRNTHVVVSITLKGEGNIVWTVDVVPYGEVSLEPVFGLD